MNSFKRRRPQAEKSTAPESPVEVKQETPAPAPESVKPSVPQPKVEVRIPAHIDRTLIMLTTKLQNAFDRIESIEKTLEDMMDQMVQVPSHSDVLEVRMHGAKLAAELARATVELRGEIGMASDEARRGARAARSAIAEEPVVETTLDLVAEEEADAKPHPFSQAG